MIKKLIPVIILFVLILIGFVVLSNPPQNARGKGGPSLGILVETLTVDKTDYPLTISSYGSAQPRTKTTLVSQVGGQIVAINPSLRPGGYFKKGDVLLGIDARDYEADVNIAEASLMDALQVEAQEAARSEQALIDWQNLSTTTETASDLVLRKPQLKAAQAKVLSARSTLVKRKLDLQRAKVIAPFDGRVLKQNVDMGQVISAGTQLAQVFATDIVEVRLPLRNADLNFIELPEAESNSELSGSKQLVEFSSDLGGSHQWQGELIRTEGEIDEVSRQLHVVAKIKEPFVSNGDAQRPVKIGEYLTAKIYAARLEQVIVIPSASIYQNTYVFTAQKMPEGRYLLQRTEVEVAWQNGVDAIVRSGIKQGDELVLTTLGQVTSGTHVRLAAKLGDLK